MATVTINPDGTLSGVTTSVPAQVKTNDELGIKDPLLTSSALPNVLDQFDLSQYTLKLSLKRDNDAASKDERVIAQTSVTATQIDDVAINTLSSGLSAGEVTFKLVQPGHVTLMDDINRFRIELGLPLSVRPMMFLEINFKGYTTDYEDNDLGGVPTTIAGPYLYKLFITDISINITESGSEYNIKSMIHNFYGITNAVAEIPVLTMALGSSLWDACETLRSSIEVYYLEEKPDYDIQDEYVFNLDDPSLSVGGTNLKFAFFTGSAMDRTNDDLKGVGTEQLQKIEGADGIEVKGGQLTFQSGVKIEQFFLVMLSMLEPFKKYIARREDGNNPMSSPKPEQTFVKWFRVLTDVEEIGYDTYRKEYARRYIYTLKILDSARTDIGQDDERPNDQQLTKRFSEIKERGLLRKAYYYIFTGRNDQVKQLDISFSAGATLLNPPGLAGFNTKSDNTAQLSNTLPPMDAKKESAYKKVDNAREEYTKLRNKIFSTQGKENRSEDDIKRDEADLKTAKDNFTVLYRSFRTEFGESYRRYLSETERLELERHRIQSLNAPDFVQSGTYFGFSNTLFGFTAYQYHLASLGSSLVRLEMTVRGDPWYLGKRQWTGNTKTELIENRPDNLDTYTKPNSREGCFYGDQTFIYLQFATPRVSMENYDDEDEDDGYWNFANKNGELSQSFSGIYMFMQATNRFSNGEFTTEIMGQLMSELSVSKLPKQTEGTGA